MLSLALICCVVDDPSSDIVNPPYCSVANSFIAPTTLVAVVVSVATSPISVDAKLLNVVLNVSNVFVVATDLTAILLT